MSHNFKSFDIMQAPLEGTSLIEAGAGTGKTFAIANLYLRLLLEKKLQVDSILVVTFTEAATAELKERIRHLLVKALKSTYDPDAYKEPVIGEILHASGTPKKNQNLLKMAIGSFDEASIFTIHGFCLRMLKENAFETGSMFDLEIIQDQSALIEEIIEDFRRIYLNSSLIVATVDNAFAIKEIKKLAHLVLNRPEAKLLITGNTVTLDKLEAIYKNIANDWLQMKDEVYRLVQQLLDDKILKKNNQKGGYGEKRLPAYFESLNALGDGQISQKNLEAITAFSRSKLLNSLTKKGQGALPKHPFFDLCESFISAKKGCLMDLKSLFISYLKSELAKRKKDKECISYNDFLYNLRDALRNDYDGILANNITSKYKAALIDEFQDTSSVQYEIFNTLFRGDDVTMFLIGDPKQAIYGFRGADVCSYLAASKETTKGRHFTQDTNWRSESNLVDAVNSLFSNMESPFGMDGAIGYTKVGSSSESKGNSSSCLIDGKKDSKPLKVLRLDGPLSKDNATRQATAFVTDEIVSLLNQGVEKRATIGDRIVLPQDIAILVMTHSQAEILRTSLTMRSVPVVLQNSGNIFKTAEADMLRTLLLALLSSGNYAKINATLASCMVGISGEQIASFVEDDTTSSEYEKHLKCFKKYGKMWEQEGFIKMFRLFLQEYRVRGKLLSLPNGERRVTNLIQLSECLHTASMEKSGTNALLNWFVEKMDDKNSISPDEESLHLASDAGAVQIMTVFNSKGLEFPIVFCPFMFKSDTDGLAPNKNSAFTVYRDGSSCINLDSTPSQESVFEAQKEAWSEIMRLLYVALTRASNRCYMVAVELQKWRSKKNLLKTSASRMQIWDDFIADRKTNGVEEIVHHPTPNIAFKPLSQPQIKLTARTLSRGRITCEWNQSSYSMLTAGVHGQKRLQNAVLRHDEPQDEQNNYLLQEVAPEGFFAFPRGAHAGTCIHDIFEKLRFAKKDYSTLLKYVGNILQKHGMGEHKDGEEESDLRLRGVCDMIERVKNAPLLPNSNALKLNMLETSSYISELEFHYPIRHISPSNLRELFAKHSAHLPDREFPEKLGRLNFAPIKGVMHGFIDMVFCFDKRYYLLDWKTNHLGNSFSDYVPEKLLESMSESFYPLQYYIYTVALHRYLAERVNNYDYESCFGGIFYLYLRGVNPEIPGNGIFYDRPSKKLIEELSGFLSPKTYKAERNNRND